MEDKEEKEEINTKEELRTIKINKEETETWEFKRRRRRSRKCQEEEEIKNMSRIVCLKVVEVEARPTPRP